MKLNKIFLILALAAGVTSCRKLLDVPEDNLLAGDLALKTVTYAEQALIGAYSAVGPDMDILLNATFADEVAKSEFYNAVTTHEWQYGPSDVGLRDNFTAIGPNYNIVNRVNVLLAALPKADSTKAGDETKRRIIRGEALFLRAFAHFRLFQYYSGNYDPNGLGMPYMETSTITPTPRIKMGEYFQKINADLATAKTLVVNSLSDINRANVAAVAGLQARVALYMRDWANAETYATEYINAVPLATIATFPSIWTDASNAEQAWRVVRTSSIGAKLGSLFRGTSPANPTGATIGLVTWKPSEKIWSSYDKVNDVRFNAYFKDEALLAGVGRPSRLIAKYAGTAYGTPGENVANGKMMRTGEMYLIRAEARAELGKVSGANSAESDIKALRENRIAGVITVTYASKQQAIDDIMFERFRELAYEGHRFFDLKRRSLPVTRLAVDAPSAAGTTLPADNFRFLLPIPQPEILSNRLMQQNPGYF